MAMYERKRILIWGKTRPELSRTYKETVCTGGILADTKRLIRLYPIPLRFLNDQQVFKKYQWIEADVRRTSGDSRPESYHIKYDTITVGEFMPTGDEYWTERADWIMAPGNVYPSLDRLLEANASQSTSLGLVRPDSILRVHAERFPDNEKAGFWDKYKQIERVRDLPFEPEAEAKIQPIRHPDFRFKVRFCSGDRESDLTVFDWEIDALYFNQIRTGRSQQQARDAVIDKIQNQVCHSTRDTHFFLGNTRAHPQSFSIVGFWWPKRRLQKTFGDYFPEAGVDELLEGVSADNLHLETDTGPAGGREEW
jgi:hypothetical protein